MAKTVLIVEDNELNMKLFRDLLEAHGYQTVGTNKGIEALDLVRRHRPDLILMDIQLPEVSGLDVTRWIKNDPELAGELATLRDERPSSLITERPRGDEVLTLIAHTRSLLWRRAIYLACALTTTCLPLVALWYRAERVHFPFERVPLFWAFCVVAAAGFWTMFVLTTRRLRVAGL